jgi:hypothetical protein
MGYFIAKYSGSILNIQDIMLKKRINPITAIASLARKLPAPYIQIKSNYNYITESLSSLSKEGILCVSQDWSTFMVKPLTKDVIKVDLKCHFGIGSDRFLFSWLDCT